MKVMAKAFNVSDVRFENENLVITIDDQLVTLELSGISEKLATATDQERRDFKISFSGYGIHWGLLDEGEDGRGKGYWFTPRRFLFNINFCRIFAL